MRHALHKASAIVHVTNYPLAIADGNANPFQSRQTSLPSKLFATASRMVLLRSFKKPLSVLIVVSLLLVVGRRRVPHDYPSRYAMY